ncbi:MAG: bifunctional diguanylate cyclase/phosphodiesterase [Candidatus Nanopelagicales bacterium]
MSVAGVLQRNDAAPRAVRRRDDALLAAALVVAVAAVWAGASAATGPTGPSELAAHLLAAGYAVLTGVAVLLAGLDRASRESVRAPYFRLLAFAGLVAWGGQSIGYVATARAPGPFQPWIEVVPLAVGTVLSGIALYRICWPGSLSAADARDLVLDGAVTVLALGIIWVAWVLPKWVYPDGPDADTYRVWEHIDQVVMFLTLSMVLLVFVMSRRITGHPFVQIALLAGGMALTLFSDLLGQTTRGWDDRSSITYSIVGYVLGASLCVAALHRPPHELEGDRAEDAREWVSVGVPLVMTGLVAAPIIWDAADELPKGAVLPIVVLLLTLLTTVLIARLRASRTLRRAQQESGRVLLAERTRDGWFRTLVGDSRELVFVIDAAATIVYASPRVESEVALHESPTPFDPEHRHPLTDVLLRTTPDELRLLLRQVSLDPSLSGPHELHLKGHAGELDVEATFRPLFDLEFEGYLVTARDITAANALRRDLDSSKNRDSLTGLLNRDGFLAAVDGRTSDDVVLPVVVLVLDIERFGALNDGLGHDTGDEILRGVARVFERLPWYVADGARISSDAFALLIVSDDPEEAVGEVVEQARNDLRGLVLPDGREVEVTFRAGYVVAPAEDAPLADWLVEAADLALARARSSRQALIVEYHEDMRAETERRLAVERDLRDAIANGRVEVHYQPIVRLHDNVVTGTEALVRLRGKDGTLVPPIEFIPLAEEIGLIDEIGLLVLDEACQRTVLASADLGRALTVSVNLAVDQLRDEIVDQVRQALARSGLPAARLTLEITESTLADLSSRTQNVLNDLRALGVSVALDDFGTGYSSMSYLATLPVDILKIDRSFVSVLGSSESGFTLARLVVQLADPLRLRTVAEGIETIEQADLLRGMGCQYGQGYLFARPMPYGDFVAAMRGPLGAAVPG